MNTKEILKRLGEIKKGTWTDERFESDWNKFYFGIIKLEKDIAKSRVVHEKKSPIPQQEDKI